MHYNIPMINYTSLETRSSLILLLFVMLLLYKLKSLWFFLMHRTLLQRHRTLKKLKALSWDDFERLSMELFEKRGWKVLGNSKKGADGGVDIWMQKGSLLGRKTKAIVQCKRYDNAMVTIKVIREMYGLMHEYGSDEVYVVTTSRFTKECHAFVKEKKFTLIDGESLVKAINKIKS